jgi:hypothetical protein
MSSDYEPGHEPTETDESNAIYFATMNQRRNACLSDPVNYVWKEDPVVGYPCPEGITCYSGRCEFTKQGCQNFSTLPYFDCKRKSVPCSFGDGTCQVCDWDIEPSGIGNIPCPAVGSPALTDADAKALGDQAVNCRPGDLKVVDQPFNPTPKPDVCRPAQSFACPGLPQTQQPYTMNGYKVPCSCSSDCETNGLGGQCLIESDKGPQPLPSSSSCSDTPVVNAYCYPPDGVYTEWREGFTEFDGAPLEDACVVSFSQARAWCEMPWTRPTTLNSDGTAADPACWKVQYKQPFYYREADGKCYVTKSYCENDMGTGGSDGSYGVQSDFVQFSNCSYPQGTDNEIQEGYDCCTNLGSSFAQFFFGQTLPTEFDNLLAYGSKIFSGSSPSTYCSNDGATVKTQVGEATSGTADPVKSQLDPLISFLSDERLKEDIELVEENACGLGIHLYRYRWGNLARRLYNKPEGVMQGLLMKELEQVFPENVRWSPYGHKMFAHVPQLMPKISDFRVFIYIGVLTYLLQSSDVIEP